MQYSEINKNNIPNHIAIIMDGNGRWAKKFSLPRLAGHKKGVQTVREITELCSMLGVKNLTLYTFSSENWERPKYEVNSLLKLLVSSIRLEIKDLVKNNIKLTAIGEINKFDKKIQNELLYAFKKTEQNTGLNLNLAISYGSRQEIINASKKIIYNVVKNEIDIEDINENYFANMLYTKDIEDPDLLIRTGGEFRMSNFLLWQIAYTEIYITERFWPEFRKEDLIKAIKDYQQRERKFGKVSE
tara:strand:+ start:504 stop:1232 length:729 start_codon:yes stop_codon:yes gene_type:complete